MTSPTNFQIGITLVGMIFFAFAIPYNIRKFRRHMDSVKTEASERAVRESREHKPVEKPE